MRPYETDKLVKVDRRPGLRFRCILPQLDFFVGISPGLGYRIPGNDLHTLTASVSKAIEIITLEMLQTTWRKIENGLDVFRVAKEFMSRLTKQHICVGKNLLSSTSSTPKTLVLVYLLEVQ